MAELSRYTLILGLFCLAAGPLGCSAATADDGDEGDVGGETGSSADELSTACSISRSQILASVSGGRRTAIERGFRWYDAGVSYSQSRSYQGYRTDCSGFVSMCWQLGTSYTTLDFSNGGGESEKLASYESMLPGDAIVRRSNGAGHIVLFLGWNDRAHSSACVLEQASTALDMEFRARTTSSLQSSGYRAIRADKF
jgi:hypothetical protein